jgi:hypothetical protein
MMAHDSAGTYGANLVGDPVWQPNGGIAGGALEFDGIDDYVDTPFALGFYAPFSICAWVKGGDLNQAIVCESTMYGHNMLLSDHIGGNLATAFLWHYDPQDALFSQVQITDGLWHHVALVWDGNAATRILYVDGVEAASRSVTSFPRSDLSHFFGELRIGASWDMTWTGLWSGLIDDVRIYRGAMSPEDVAALVQ